MMGLSIKNHLNMALLKETLKRLNFQECVCVYVFVCIKIMRVISVYFLNNKCISISKSYKMYRLHVHKCLVSK